MSVHRRLRGRHRSSRPASLLTVIAGLGALALGACSSTDATTDAAATSTSTTTASPSTTARPATAAGTPRKDGLRGVRYCEVLLLANDAGNFRAEVWNTLGMNDCPQADWQALDAPTIAKERGVAAAVLNGPRYWTLDSITSDIRADAPETTFGNLGMFRAATIDLGPNLPSQTPYTERGINRETVFGFDAGTEVHELVTPDGTSYVMQSYSQIKDPAMNAAALATLGNRLELPEGWAYRVRTLAEPLDLVSTDGVATVLQDEFQNTYQRVDTPS